MRASPFQSLQSLINRYRQDYWRGKGMRQIPLARNLVMHGQRTTTSVVIPYKDFIGKPRQNIQKNLKSCGVK